MGVAKDYAVYMKTVICNHAATTHIIGEQSVFSPPIFFCNSELELKLSTTPADRSAMF